MKNLKRAICLIAAFVMCVSLCGCGLLDDLRESRATMDAEGNIWLSDGACYKLLPSCKELAPSFGEKMVYVVDSEVPLLLTSVLGECFDLSDDGLFLQNYWEGESITYCRTDVYDSVLQRILNGFNPDTCCYWVYDYNTGVSIPCVLTDAQLDAVNQVCQTQDAQILPSGATMGWEYWVMLTMCSDDFLFSKDFVEICTVDDKWYVVDESGIDAIFYTVPGDLSPVFEEIMNTYIQMEELYWGAR